MGVNKGGRSHIEACFIDAYIAAYGDDARQQGLLSAIMRGGITLAPVIYDNGEFYTEFGERIPRFGHDTERLAASAIQLWDDANGHRVELFVPEADVDLPWCDLVKVTIKDDGSYEVVAIEVKSNGFVGANRLGTKVGGDVVSDYARLGEKMRLSLEASNIKLCLLLMEKMADGVYRVGETTISAEGAIIRSPEQIEVTKNAWGNIPSVTRSMISFQVY